MPTMSCPEWVRDLNLWSDRVMHADPYPRYAELRNACPVAHSDALGGHWLVTKHADIVRILLDPVTFSSVTKTVPPFEDPLGVQIPGEVDGLEHTRYRQSVLSMFSPERVGEMESTAREIMQRLIARVGPPGFEFVHTIAIPYVFEMIMHTFGIPAEHHAMVMEWEDGGLRKAPHDPELTQEMGRFLARLIAERRDNPLAEPRDLLDHLATARFDGERLLTFDEAVRIAVFVLKAGLHTTVNALGNCMCFLVEHPDLRDLLLADPNHLPHVLEELMRWESILVITRTATRDVEIDGNLVREGEHLLLLTGSAGRDSEAFERADEFDITRRNVNHLMFGVGPHRCVGRHLARLELRIALEEIHRLLPTYRGDPDRPPKRYPAMSRGAKELYLLIDHQGAR